jgi:hypothetical protein
VCII